MMYVFEYMIYHLKPFGITTQLTVPLNPAETSKAPDIHHDNPSDKHSKAASTQHNDENTIRKHRSNKHIKPLEERPKVKDGTLDTQNENDLFVNYAKDAARQNV